MASKTINIDAELYEKLKQLKKEKSFTEFLTEVVEKMTTPPLDLFGILEGEDLEYEEIKQSRTDRDVSI